MLHGDLLSTIRPRRGTHPNQMRENLNMTNHTIEPTPRTAARVAGIGYIVIFALAIFANFFVRVGLVEPDDAATTFRNIADSEFLFRTALVAFLVVFVLDVVVAWALYIVFRPTGTRRSQLAAWFRLVYTVFLGIAVIFLFLALQFVGGAEFLGAFEPTQLNAQLMLALEAFNYTWLIGLAAFGIHLILIGNIMLRSGIAPKGLGIVLAIAGGAYVFDTLAYALLSNYAEYEDIFVAIVAVPSVIAELAFAWWLLARAGR